MMYYISHKFGGKPENLKRAKRITNDLQIKDTENCYICPLLAFSYLGYNEIGYEEEMALCEDLLILCDKLIVASDVSEGVKREIDLAEKCKMEIEYL